MTGSGGVTLGSKTLTLTGTGSSFDGIISGSGGLSLTGAGTHTLTGANTYTGATTIGAGTELVLSGTGSIATSSGVTANGDFDIASHAGNVSIKNLAGAVGGTVTLGSNTLILTACQRHLRGRRSSGSVV